MWSNGNMDLESLDLMLDENQKAKKVEFEPSPYMFTKLENGRKITIDSSSIIPPMWLLLDHTIAVIWLLFSMKIPLQQLSADDLKWAYEFLKEVRNAKGENPPDVKTCLKEIQDRLINLYANMTASKDENFDDIAAAYGEKIMADTNNYLRACALSPTKIVKSVESQSDTFSLCDSLYPSKTAIKVEYHPLSHHHSSKDITEKSSRKSISAKHKRIAMNYSKNAFPFLDKDSNIFEDSENADDEEVENYILRLFDDDKKTNLNTRTSFKSLIPTKRKTPTTVSFSGLISAENSIKDFTKKEKTSKKVHCVAEMRSLKFQKSMKVQETSMNDGGEEAAYSNLKAEIQRLTINPNVSKREMMKFLKEWKSEQMDKLNNDLKRLNSIEDFMKSISSEVVEQKPRQNSTLKLESTKSTYSITKSLLP